MERHATSLVCLFTATLVMNAPKEAHAQRPPGDAMQTTQPNIEKRRQSPDDVRQVAPALEAYTQDRLYGDVWKRPQLTPRDRSLVTVSALIAMNRPDQLRSHLALARRNGVTEEELVEAITHLAFYAGWPNAVTAIQVAKEVFNRN